MIKVASFLTESEIKRVRSGLTGQRIEHFITSTGTASGQYHDPYFEVSVNEDDFSTAKKIITGITAKTRKEIQQCPKCKESEYKELEKTGFWAKLLYKDTTHVQCKKCGTRYVI